MTITSRDMSRTPNMEFAHIDLATPYFADWSMDSVQIDNGETLSTVRVLDLDGLNILHNSESHSLVHNWRLDPGKTAFSFFARDMTEGSWCGFEVGAGDFLVATDRRDHFAKTPARFEQVVLTIDTDLLEAWGALPSRLGSRAFADGSGVLRLPPSGRRLTSFLFALMAPRGLTVCDTNEELKTEILSMLRGALRDTDEGNTYRAEPPRSGGHAAVRRAMQAMKSNTRLVHASDLAQELSMSPRALELAFKREVGVSPHQFMRWYRLQNVRLALLNARAGSDLIKQIARANGFSDLGRFAGYYQQAYGELPSDTLLR
ncbi:MAG: helix-turn-helix domain-containing protein [Pseudomonadota bacterium]